MRSGGLLELRCCNGVTHLASLRVRRVFIADCEKLKMVALEWP
jgi:hypothetical protein